jgi:hypothetical protein
MQVTLSTGRAVEIAPLKMGQLRRMTETVNEGKALDATVNACVDSMKNADPTGAPVSVVWFEDEFTVLECNELFAKVAEVSGIVLGEATASR